MDLVKKWPFFHPFILGIIGQQNIFYDSVQRKNAFLGYKNKKLIKWKNWDFSKGVSPWFKSKIGNFSIFLILGNIGELNVFYDNLERKNACLAYKNKRLKKWKIWDFSIRVTPWFLSKIGHFSILLIFLNIHHQNVFYDSLEQKNAFLCYKNKKFKTSKNRDFSIGVSPWFWSKIGHFYFFLFTAI